MYFKVLLYTSMKSDQNNRPFKSLNFWFDVDFCLRESIFEKSNGSYKGYYEFKEVFTSIYLQ